MATKKKTPQKKMPAPFIGFINFTPTEAEKAEYKKVEWTLEDVFVRMDALVEDEISVKFSWDSYNKCYQCVLGRVDPAHPDAGIFVSGRGADTVRALKQALYVHHVICDGEWSQVYYAQRQTVFIDE